MQVRSKRRQAICTVMFACSGSDTAVFRTKVVEGDADSDGIGSDANSLTLRGGCTSDGAGNDAGLSHAAVAAAGGQRVDTSPPQG